MRRMSAKHSVDTKVSPVDDDLELRRHSTVAEGIVETEEDTFNRQFYGSGISDAYRMKSELVAHHISEIGMGK